MLCIALSQWLTQRLGEMQTGLTVLLHVEHVARYDNATSRTVEGACHVSSRFHPHAYDHAKLHIPITNYTVHTRSVTILEVTNEIYP